MTGLILESSFCKWFGFDNVAEEWTFVGDGNVPLAVTSEEDVGRFTTEAVLLALQDPTSVPSIVRTQSSNESLLDYAAIMDSVAGSTTRLKSTPLAEAKARYEAEKANIPPHMLGPLMSVLMAEGGFDHAECANELLNPGGKKWTSKTVRDYAQETGGRPWKEGNLFGK